MARRPSFRRALVKTRLSRWVIEKQAAIQDPDTGRIVEGPAALSSRLAAEADAEARGCPPRREQDARR